MSTTQTLSEPSGVTQHVSALMPSGLHGNARRRSVAGYEMDRDDIPPEDMLALTKTASAISGHRSEYLRQAEIGTHTWQAEVVASASIARPVPMKLGPIDTIHELPSDFVTTPTTERRMGFMSVSSTRPPSPITAPQTPPELFDVEDHTVAGYPDIGTINSWRGCCILLITCGAQMMDNVYMTGVNISLPAIQKEFGVDSGSLQWLISAYTLTFGGFLLLAGVMSDRYGRKQVFCAGMAWLSIWTIADGFATSFIQLAIFRALQGIGAAMTVPSGVGIISSFFVARDRTKALSYFGAAGAVGFCLGLILGGFLTSSLGWRYLFYLTVIITGGLAAVGWLTLPVDRKEGHVKPRLDFLGAAISTAGLILLSFVISSGGEYGWGTAFIIVLLILSVALLVFFAFVEKKVQNPIMPLSLWKTPNFAALWVAGFVAYGGYQTILYYAILTSQEVLHLSAGGTALRFIPMACVGATVVLSLGQVMERFDTKHLLLVGLTFCAVAPIPCAMISRDDISFWKHVFPTSIISVIGIGITYSTITVVAMASVPLSAKSLCGGMINTAFQIGSGVGLALASAVVQSTETNKGHGLLEQYKTGLWCCVGLAGVGLVSTAFGVKSVNVGHMPVAIH
ncbi:hypothetical protein LTR36_008064 [Oleoguttula mirabilis]|uniref:Major facilitator superfamily (MFS) profile domain-containing protein n=1 Tax=Oleoguttula mirabilis TaxID=1507867 RepID=A0AAV9J8H9_9PEZI|nr:hypothetical protein LTR36_008064 [Oleoguttula mirabilis]